MPKLFRHSEETKAKISAANRRHGPPRVAISCRECGEVEYVPPSVAATKKYCSYDCKNRHELEHRVRNCQICEEEYHPTGTKQRWCLTCVPSRRWQRVAKLYGINYPQWIKIYRKQGGRCAICKRHSSECYKPNGGKPKGKEPTSGDRSNAFGLVIDHDHKTGKVRGLLCSECNQKLGHVENKVWMEKALEYLSNFG